MNPDYEVMRTLKKWSWAVAAAAVVVIGCGGGGGGSSTSGGNGGNNGGSGGNTPVVSLGTGNIGQVNLYFLSGAGRAAGDVSAVLTQMALTSGVTRFAGPTSSPTVQLNGYTNPTLSLNVDTAGTNSRLLDNLEFNVLRLRVDAGNGAFNFFPSSGNTDPLFTDLFPTNVRAFPGRFTNFRVRLNETMFPFTDGIPDFLRDVFIAQNEDPDNPGILAPGFLSDMVAFDVSAMGADRPSFPVSGGLADVVYFSGDIVAMSTAENSGGPTNQTGAMEVIADGGNLDAQWERTLVGGNVVRSYRVLQDDPRFAPGEQTIPFWEGLWRPVTQVVNNLGSFQVLTFPSSSDDQFQTIVLFARSGNSITNLYYGTINLQTGTFTAVPVSTLGTGGGGGDITGTVTNLLNKAGQTLNPSDPGYNPASVRSGTFNIDGTLPSGFNATGTFLVFRI